MTLYSPDKWDKLGDSNLEKASLTLSLPRTMKNFIAEKIREGRFSTPSGCIRSLLRDDQDMTGNSGVALLIRRGVLAGGGRRESGLAPRRDKPAAKMKAPKGDLESFGAMMAETGHFDILLTEDNLEDAELVRLALKEYSVKYTLRVIRDGVEAITFLGSLDGDPKSPALDLLIVDMNLPKRSGEDILKRLRSTENYAQTPVIVMSGLIAGAIEEKATMVYFQKPLTLDGFMRLGWIFGNVLQEQTRGDA